MTNSLQESPRKVAVVASYCRKVSTGYKLVFDGKDGKKNSLRVLPYEDCFARAAGKKTTSSGLYRRWSSCKAARSAERDGLVNEKSITNLKVSSFKDKEEDAPIWPMYCRTTCTSQVDLYLGRGGLEWKVPFNNLLMTGCFPTSVPSTVSCTGRPVSIQ